MFHSFVIHRLQLLLLDIRPLHFEVHEGEIFLVKGDPLDLVHRFVLISFGDGTAQVCVVLVENIPKFLGYFRVLLKSGAAAEGRDEPMTNAFLSNYLYQHPLEIGWQAISKDSIHKDT